MTDFPSPFLHLFGKNVPAEPSKRPYGNFYFSLWGVEIFPTGRLKNPDGVFSGHDGSAGQTG